MFVYRFHYSILEVWMRYGKKFEDVWNTVKNKRVLALSMGTLKELNSFNHILSIWTFS